MSDEQKLFFDRINALGTGERAALRRNAGKMLQQADGTAIGAFYRCYPLSDSRQEDRWFAVACIRCLWDADEGSGKPMEQVISELLKSDILSDSVKHRVELLIDSRWDEDGYLLSKLTRLIKLIKQRTDRTGIDCGSLLNDLVYWNSPSQNVQRKWARCIFSNVINTEEKEN